MLAPPADSIVRRLADRFCEAAQSCCDRAQLGRLIHGVVEEMGFHFFALLDHASLAAPTGGFVRVDNYPEAWVSELVGKGWAADDPVHLACGRTNAGFGWCDLGTIVALGQRHKRILARSRRFGIGAGFTVPSNVPGEPSASCSFAVRTDCELPLTRLHCAELIGAHALSALRRLRPMPSGPPRPHLSRRELQCLRLVSIGKTDWEIGVILGISTETARQYVKRARLAYDAVSRTQLVVYGLRDQWLFYDDAIPPNG